MAKCYSLFFLSFFILWNSTFFSKTFFFLHNSVQLIYLSPINDLTHFWSNLCKCLLCEIIGVELNWINCIIIHQTHYEKSDWSRAFNQFTTACELDMINAISAADIAFIMSSSTSAWLLSHLESSPQKQNGWTLRFCFWGWIMWTMCYRTIIEFGFRMISWIIKTSCLCYLPQPSADNTDLGFINSWYHAQPHPRIVVWLTRSVKPHYGITWFLYFFIYLSMRVECLSRGLVSTVYVV